MRIFQIFLALAALFALAACGGGGGGFGGSTGVGGFSAATLNSQLNNATGPGDTVANQIITSGGVAGVLAMAPGIGTQAGLQSIKVRTSTDYQTAFVSINGGPEMTLAATFASTSTGGGYGTTGPNANYVGLSNLADVSLVTRTSGTNGGFGYVGIATPAPTLSDLTYTGTWNGFVNPNTVSTSPTFGTGGGPMTLTLTTSSQDLDGTFSGDLNIGSGGSSTTYPVSGIVDTTLSGSIFSGTMTATTGTYTGASDIAGVFYGDNAETAAGAFGGSISGPSGTHPFYGIFNLN